MIKTIDVNRHVADSTSNNSGIELFQAVDAALGLSYIVHLSLKEVQPMSSSFMNSFFGELIDKYGLQEIRSKVRLVDYRKSEALRIKNYLDRYNNVTC